jgi:antitoxin HigA-1
MASIKEKKVTDFRIEIGSNEPRTWSEKDIAELKAQSREITRNRSSEQKLKNELMAIRYEMEEYLDNDSPTNKPLTIEKAISDYLEVLNLPFRKFALCLDTTDGNLRKYLSGERKFNKDLALKFASFFHTSPELWLLLQLKNELMELKKEKKQVKRYEKYDYRKALAFSRR